MLLPAATNNKRFLFLAQWCNCVLFKQPHKEGSFNDNFPKWPATKYDDHLQVFWIANNLPLFAVPAGPGEPGGEGCLIFQIVSSHCFFNLSNLSANNNFLVDKIIIPDDSSQDWLPRFVKRTSPATWRSGRASMPLDRPLLRLTTMVSRVMLMMLIFQACLRTAFSSKWPSW